MVRTGGGGADTFGRLLGGEGRGDALCLESQCLGVEVWGSGLSARTVMRQVATDKAMHPPSDQNCIGTPFAPVILLPLGSDPYLAPPLPYVLFAAPQPRWWSA